MKIRDSVIKSFIPTHLRRDKFNIQCGSTNFPLGTKTALMGVLNITPDSFSGDGFIKRGAIDYPQVVSFTQRLVEDGADIIDVGGESSRPGSRKITTDEEINRIIPVIKLLSKNISAPISVDTYKSRVAKEALDAGASLINIIKGMNPERNLLKMIKSYNASLVLMHMPGTPRTMQQNIHYQNIIEEIKDALQASIENCLDVGIAPEKILIDPGIGFGKTVDQNLTLINHLEKFKTLNKPILIGTSRKSFIGKVLEVDLNERLTGTIASVCASVLRGAHIVRAHDIKAIRQSVDMIDAILNEKKGEA